MISPRLQNALDYASSKLLPDSLCIVTPSQEEEKTRCSVYENMLYALALFRTKESERILRGQELLAQLLYFQNHCLEQEKGNFPVFFDHYPFCKDRLNGLWIFYVLLQIRHEFYSILRQELKERLCFALEELRSFCLLAHRERSFPFIETLLLYSCTETPLPSLKGSETFWMIPTEVAKLMLCAPAGSELRKKIEAHLQRHWSSQFHAYCGPAWQERYQEHHPDLNVLTPLLSGKPTHTFFDLESILLEDWSIFPSTPLSQKGHLGEELWETHLTPHTALALLEQKEEVSPPQHITRHPLRLFWGSSEKLRSFVCQAPTTHISFHHEKENTILQFALPSIEELPSKGGLEELSFFLSAVEDVSFSDSTGKASLFSLGETITCSTPLLSLKLRFDLAEGEGQFWIQLRKGNRLSQQACRHEKRFEAYDWELVLRTIRRNSPCCIHVTMQMKENTPS